MQGSPWSHIIRLNQVGRTPISVDLSADDAARKRIAKLLGLAELRALEAHVTVEPWLDGAEIEGHWRADLVQTCGVTLEPIESAPGSDFVVRVVGADSPNAPAEDAEIDLDPDAPDPPDVLERDEIDLAGYVVEHLALEIDPFPRKPGVAFEPPPESEELSPFSVLRGLKPPKEE